MDIQNIQNFIGNTSMSLSRAMQKIDTNSYGILFIVDENEELVACITDGDIRRFLLAGGKMDDMALSAANKKTRVAKTKSEAQKLYHIRDCKVIPIIDGNKHIVHLYSESSSDEKTKKALNIPVVINAGGRGTRLDPFTRVLPKPLIPIGDIPIIELIMQQYQSYSCNEFHIIVNYKHNLMKAYFADNENDYNISWYVEKKPLGTGGGLSLLKGKFKSTFFFANCDALLTSNYEQILKFHKDNGNSITMICAYKNIDIPYGVVEMGVNGVIKEMKEKPLLSFLTNTGIYIVEPDVVDNMIDDESIGFPDVIEREKQKGKKVAVFPVGENEWMDMGQLSELEKMRNRLLGE